MRRRSHRGGSAVEGALLTSALIVLLLGGLEYGLYFFRLSQLEALVRDSARDAAAVLVTDDPAAAFEVELTDRVSGVGMDASALVIDAEVSGDPGFRALDVTVRMEWVSVTGLIPAPSLIGVTHSTRLEDQSRSQ